MPVLAVFGRLGILILAELCAVIFLPQLLGPRSTALRAPTPSVMLTEELPHLEPGLVVLPIATRGGHSPREVVRPPVRQLRRPLLKRPSAAIVVLAPLTEEADERRETKASRRQEARPAEPPALGHLRESSVRPATAAEYHMIYEAHLQPVLGLAGLRLVATA